MNKYGSPPSADACSEMSNGVPRSTRNRPKVYAAVLDWRSVALHVQALTLISRKSYDVRACISLNAGRSDKHSAANRPGWERIVSMVISLEKKQPRRHLDAPRCALQNISYNYDRYDSCGTYSKLLGRCRGQFEEFALEHRQRQHDTSKEEPDPCILIKEKMAEYKTVNAPTTTPYPTLWPRMKVTMSAGLGVRSG